LISLSMEQVCSKFRETFLRYSYNHVNTFLAGNFLAPAETLSYRAFRTVIEIDLLGTFNTTRACFPYLKRSKGCVINVSATLHYQSTLYQVNIGNIV